MLTVKEMINKCKFWDFEILTGEDGLNSVISYVTVPDAPDPSQWTKGEEFVKDLITKNIRSIEEVKKRAKIFGWEFNNKIVVVMLDIDNYKAEYFKMKQKKDNLNLEITRERIFEIVTGHIKRNFEQPVYTTLSDSITFILNVKNPNIFKTKLSRICNRLLLMVKEETGFTLSIGIGNIKDGVMLAKESYTEAFRVVQINRLSNLTNNYKFYNEAGLYRLYYDISTTGYGKEFCSENLDKLIEYDKTNKTHLFDTLSCLNEIYSFRKDT
ncbi:MAG: hypothetical protein WCY24_02835 [Lutispora sp.]